MTPPVELPDQAADVPAFEGEEPPFTVTYERAGDRTEEAFETAFAGFGNGRVELHYEDGRHVTLGPDEILEVK